MASKTINALFTAVAVSALLGGTYAVAAQGDRGGSREGEREMAAAAPAVSLEQAIAKVRERYQGQIVETDLETEDGRARYEVKLVDDQGRRRKVYVDGSSGDLQAMEGRRGEEREEHEDD